MPAATTRQDLLDRTARDYAKLDRLLDTVPETARLTPDPDADGTTLKDIVGHRAAWIELFLGWYAEGQAGCAVAIPAPGYKWNELKRFNADLRQTQQDLTWQEARQLLSRNHARLIDLIGSLSQEALYGAPMQGGGNKWTTGRWAEAAGASHYKSAARYVRARMRDMAKGAT